MIHIFAYIDESKRFIHDLINYMFFLWKIEAKFLTLVYRTEVYKYDIKPWYWLKGIYLYDRSETHYSELPCN